MQALLKFNACDYFGPQSCRHVPNIRLAAALCCCVQCINEVDDHHQRSTDWYSTSYVLFKLSACVLPYRVRLQYTFIHSYSFIKVGLTHCDNLKYIAKVENSVNSTVLSCLRGCPPSGLPLNTQPLIVSCQYYLFSNVALAVRLPWVDVSLINLLGTERIVTAAPWLCLSVREKKTWKTTDKKVMWLGVNKLMWWWTQVIKCWWRLTLIFDLELESSNWWHDWQHAIWRWANTRTTSISLLKCWAYRRIHYDYTVLLMHKYIA